MLVAAVGALLYMLPEVPAVGVPVDLEPELDSPLLLDLTLLLLVVEEMADHLQEVMEVKVLILYFLP